MTSQKLPAMQTLCSCPAFINVILKSIGRGTALLMRHIHYQKKREMGNEGLINLLKGSGLGMVAVAFGRVKREHQSSRCTVSPQEQRRTVILLERFLPIYIYVFCYNHTSRVQVIMQMQDNGRIVMTCVQSSLIRSLSWYNEGLLSSLC